MAGGGCVAAISYVRAQVMLGVCLTIKDRVLRCVASSLFALASSFVAAASLPTQAYAQSATKSPIPRDYQMLQQSLNAGTPHRRGHPRTVTRNIE
jgi:hypothetical protein